MTLSLQATQYRLAQHYLGKLQKAEKATRRGLQNRLHWLNVMQQDWGQIKHWQAWSASWTDSEIEKARLCSAFPLATSSIIRIRMLPSESLTWMVQALEAARRLQDEDAERELLYLICLMHQNMEAYSSVEEHASELLERAQAVTDEINSARALCMLGEAKVFQGDYANAQPLFEKSQTLFVSNNATEELNMVWQGLGRIALWRGDYRQAHMYNVRMLESQIAAGRDGAIAVAHLSLSGIHIYLKEFKEAQFHAQRAVAIGRRINFTRFIPAALITLAHAEKWLGNLETACSHYEEALAGRSLMTPSTVINCLYGLGQARFRLGELEKANQHFDEAVKLARDGRILFRLCEVLPDLVVVHVLKSDLETARGLLKELLTGAIQLHTLHFMVNALGAAVCLWQSAGMADLAAKWAGVLTNHEEQVDSTLFGKTMHERLEKQLGTAHYQQAIEIGRTSTLDNALEEVLSLLDSPL